MLFARFNFASRCYARERCRPLSFVVVQGSEKDWKKEVISRTSGKIYKNSKRFAVMDERLRGRKAALKSGIY